MNESTNTARPTIGIVGFLGGLVTGLGIAVAIALYLTNSPVPFVNKVQRPTENITPDAGDPNHPLFSPQIPGPAAPGEAGTPGPAPAPAAAAPAAPRDTAAAPRAAGEPLVPPPSPVPDANGAPGEAGTRLMLQVGAYRNADDADAIRARLALLGLDAKVSSTQTDGATLYRVRLGPYGQLDDLNGIRRTLSENGMEPQLVHVR
jgi:cell division septation protein DedD